MGLGFRVKLLKVIVGMSTADTVRPSWDDNRISRGFHLGIVRHLTISQLKL